MSRPSLRELWTSSAPDIIAKYGQTTRARLSGWRADARAAEVLVPTRNGAADLPRLLASLALSTIPLRITVAANNCTDATMEIADQLGATAIETPGGKMGATKAGLAHIEAERGLGVVLLTDDDATLQGAWARLMVARAAELRRRVEDRPIAVCGSAIFVAGQHLWVDVLRSSYDVLLDVKKHLLRKNAIARGYNLAFGFDAAGTLHSAIERIPDTFYPGEDTAMADAVLECGGMIGNCLHVGAIAVTRNDRVSSFADFLAMRGGGKDSAARHAALYRE